MPRFEPFAGLRYRTATVTLDDVVAPPYDVISESDRVDLEARSPYNSVRVELPRDAPPLDRYQAAARLIDDWRSGGVLAADDRAALYAYRMRFTDEAGRERETVGVIGALGLEPIGAGGILPHERTMPKPKSDRLDLLRATRANLSPIWGLSLAAGLSRLIPPAASAVRCTDDDDVDHELWPVTDPGAIAAIGASVGAAPVVVADGHHRLETALAYQQERRAAAADRPGGYDLVMALMVELAPEQLSVRAIHRLIAGLPEGFDIPGAFAEAFDLMATDPPDRSIGDRMLDSGSLALVTPSRTWLARPRPGTDVADEALDSARLDRALATFPAHDLTYQHGWDLAAGAVAHGDAQVAVLLRPAGIEQIAATGRGGARMPPKTTFFWPKPRTGLVFRDVSS